MKSKSPKFQNFSTSKFSTTSEQEKIRKILRQQALKFQRMEEVYTWSGMLTADKYSGLEKDYYITEDGKRLFFHLKHCKHQDLVGILGLQGVGKTALLLQLSRALGKEALFIPWSKNWKETIQELMFEKLKGLDKALEDFLSDYRYVFIDFPDYPKKEKRRMWSDLTAVGELWKRTKNATFVLAIQKEMSSDHFLIGKMNVYELSPLKPSEICEIYKRKWSDTFPFTEEALTLLAELSRGVFRRFMKYVGKCIEEATLKKAEPPLSVEWVRQVITEEQLAKDMDLELTDIFGKNEEQKVMAVRLLNCLREHKEINQTKLAELLGVSDATVSRLVTRLEGRGYIKRKRGLHAEWLVFLA